MTQFKNHKATESPNLLVGLNNPDDGGVIQVGDQKIIQTVDFFTPILDNPYDWGRVAAANALSDVYAMGGEPISALQLVCWPRSELSFDILSEVIKGGLDTMQKANCTVIGGHSIDDKEPKYGFSITGVIKDKIFKNNEIKLLGEFVILVYPDSYLSTSLNLDENFCRPFLNFLSPTDASKLIAKITSFSKQEVYKFLLEISK